MSKPKEVTYKVVKSIDLQSAMVASRKSTVACRTTQRNDSIVWDQTVCILMENIDLAAVKKNTDKETIQKNGLKLKEILATYILDTYGDLPEMGKDRDGKDFRIVGAKGPQWSKWEETRRMFDYAGSVAKILSYGLEEQLYPESLKVGARCQLLALCKANESAIDAVVRHTGELQTALDGMKVEADINRAHNLVDALVVNNLEPEVELMALINKLGAILDVSDQDTKDNVQTALLKVAVKHFQ